MIIIYYDKSLKSQKENLFNFIKLRKTFYGNEIYGVDTFDKFKYLISLFCKLNNYYYIISSGSCAKEYLDSEYFEENRIIDFIIYCFDKEIYLPLKKKCSKISMVENESFDNVIEQIKIGFPSCQIKEYDILKHCSSFLLKSEYNGTPLKIHKQISEYFDENFESTAFDENIKIKILDILNKIAPTKYDYELAKEMIENLNDEKDLIKCYTAESIIVYFFNKCLREVDKNCIEFTGLLNYALYKYYNDNPDININKDTIFYRKLIIPIKDLYSYNLFEGQIICFPSFTSTSINENAFPFPEIKKHKLSMYSTNLLGQQKVYSKDKCVLLKFNYKYNNLNYCPAFNIKNCSIFDEENEFLFPPFSFFKILKFNDAEGTSSSPIIIELEVIPKRENLEKYLKKGRKIFYDKIEKCMKWKENKEEEDDDEKEEEEEN